MLQATSTNLPSKHDPEMGISIAEHALNLGADAVPSFEELVKRARTINTLERMPLTNEKRLEREYSELLRVYQTISMASSTNEAYPLEARTKLSKELGAMMQPFLRRHEARKAVYSDVSASPSPPTASPHRDTENSTIANVWLIPEVDPPKAPERCEIPGTTTATPSQKEQHAQGETTNLKKKRSSWYLTNVVDYFKLPRRNSQVALK